MDSSTRTLLSPVYEDLRLVDVTRLRRIVRMGAYEGRTTGLAAGMLQANLVVVPRRLAADFHDFCVANPKACPLVGVGRIGSPFLPTLGDIDIRTDLPQYDVYSNGELLRQQPDIFDLWRDNLAAFAIGSSATVEYALMERGVVPRRSDVGKAPPLYRTAIPCNSVGAFRGEVVVSMRLVRASQIDIVRAVTARFPQAHGSPIHVGDPEIIGIDDLTNPDWGDPIEIRQGEVPVFWTSGMTAISAAVGARPKVAITQTPGHMLVTDVPARADVGTFKVF